MKNILLLMTAVVAMTACGNKTKTNASDTDSTIVSEIPDTLHTVEAVERQVDAVYAYWNDLREHFDENRPSVDEQFGSKEWWRVRQEVAAIDRESESGSFFNFDDEGPLDPWTYDCYEGAISANDIEVTLLSDSTAEVRFLVKDAVTPKGVPIRWLMRLEDHQWRVANIFFVKDDNMDILMNMRNYIENNK